MFSMLFDDNAFWALGMGRGPGLRFFVADHSDVTIVVG